MDLSLPKLSAKKWYKKSLKHGPNFGPFWVPFWDPKNVLFLHRFSAFLWFQPKHPLKSDVLVPIHVFKIWSEKYRKLSSRLHARPKMRLCLFRKSLLFRHVTTWKLCSRRGQRRIFTSLRLCQKIRNKCIVFLKIAFYDVNMHIFLARGSQNDEKWWSPDPLISHMCLPWRSLDWTWPIQAPSGPHVGARLSSDWIRFG